MRKTLVNLLFLGFLATPAGAQMDVPQTRIHLESAPVMEASEGSRRALGVMGAELDIESGRVKQVFDGSYLQVLKIVPGDVIIAVNNKPYTAKLAVKECRAYPGKIVLLTILRVNVVYSFDSPLTYRVPLVDVRILKDQSPIFAELYRRSKSM